MRTFLTALAVLIAGTSLLLAQPPVTKPPAAPPSSAQLDSVLNQWEKQMQGVESLHAQLIRTTLISAFRTTEVFEGGAKFLKPNRALFDLRKKGDPQMFERFVFTDASIYVFRPQDKKIYVHKPPERKPGQVTDDNVMAFVFGMKAEDAKRRYDLSLHKLEDPNYWYIAVQPRAAEDRQDFVSAWLILYRSNYLPRQFRYTQPNKDEITYDIPRMEVNSKNVVATDFAAPQLPAGWKWEMTPVRPNPQGGGTLPPRVVRPNGK